MALSPVLRPAEVAGLLGDSSTIRLLDVRTPGEYETVHIRGAYNVPLDKLGEHAREIGNVADPIVLVCQSGQRARKAEETLMAAGMSNLHVLDGGVNGWLAAGLPITRGAERPSLERQVRVAAGALAAAGGLLAALVNPAFGFLAAFVGGGLLFAGLTDTCGMAMLLAKLPYNRPANCDVVAMVRALADGRAPAGLSRGPR
ncbi:MAG: rhodanese-like domain-containing protein [Gemmatimonadaceae bacterium]